MDRDHATALRTGTRRTVQGGHHPERSQGGYAGKWARKAPSLAVALNCGTGSSFLNALVKAFDKLHIVLAENSGYCGSKYSRWTSGSRVLGASNLPSTNAEYKISLAVSSVICVFLHNSTWRCKGSKFRWILSTPTESVSIKLKLLVCLARTGVNTPQTANTEMARSLTTSRLEGTSGLPATWAR